MVADEQRPDLDRWYPGLKALTPSLSPFETEPQPQLPEPRLLIMLLPRHWMAMLLNLFEKPSNHNLWLLHELGSIRKAEKTPLSIKA